ncbi:putative transcriptional regulatory protein [Pseudocercospora fuligena]|uniref:Putative transcriptional regulatory protein n=1 Tax=Pseudocercospora fuligena TaxID=685502 RepID=A0A8H6RLK7_9PEZI|nr:putative transcriptional regulatory protein [Pseudocercospora fuligena]
MQRVDGGAAIPPPKQSQQQQQPKALRFVTNYGAPHPKRGRVYQKHRSDKSLDSRRIGAACMTCRKRKTACSGEKPTCETCKQNKLDCGGYTETAVPTPNRKTSDASQRRPPEQPPQNVDFAKRSPFSPENALSRTQSGGNDLTRVASGGQSPRSYTERRPGSPDGSRNGEPRESLFSGPRNRMPYFRWLGPTAIMPGFKQMVVKVKRNDTDPHGRTSTDGGIRSPSLNNLHATETRVASLYSSTPAAVDSEVRTPLTLPFYDTSAVPPSELITHLANTFFTHLGCNYPFLQRERFLRDLEEKQVDPVLVDAVCALAARFSTHSLLTQAAGHDGEKSTPAEYGHAFAQRAKTALTDTFPCPTVAAAQAALLLAYNEFGEQRDSGLWMYLGISIRMAQDLGLHKTEGLRYMGKDGPTPKVVKQQQRDAARTGVPYKESSLSREDGKKAKSEKEQTPEEEKDAEETKQVERERVDTFWAIFFLDRVVSSGTGRRSTLRDKDIELSFPCMKQPNNKSEYPPPFPALIRIVHLYGRVADLLNSLKEATDITADTPKRLAAMESQVTQFYQGLSLKLHFDAVNFQHYMKAGEGTNFVLLHFWFHTLIVLLHQPTLLMTFSGRMLKLFPNSQQLSMSSAKTIADILSYSQLMDAKASLGNPFTSQPIYIAACAFLRETAEQTATSNAQSRANSPHRGSSRDATSTSDNTSSSHGTPLDAAARKVSITSITNSPNGKPIANAASEPKSQLAKHTLLATAANQHYQLCYKALQSLETYWAGAKYILTILDQKFEGVGDPLLYTAEEAESSMEQPKPEPAFTSPGWRRKLSWGPYITNPALQSPFWPPKGFGQVPGSPGHGDPSKAAIGWTLTGNMDSNSTNLAWHYASDAANHSNIDPRLSSLNPSAYEAATGQIANVEYPGHLRTSSSSSQRLASGQDNLARQKPQQRFPGIQNSDAESLLALSSPTFSQQGSAASPANPTSSGYQHQPHNLHPGMHGLPTSAGSHANMNGGIDRHGYPPEPVGLMGAGQLPMNFMPGDMMIESQDVDMSILGLDMNTWFDPDTVIPRQ